MKLAEMYESLGEVRKALDLVLQGTSSLREPRIVNLISLQLTVIESRKGRPSGKQDTGDHEADPARPSLFEEKV